MVHVQCRPTRWPGNACVRRGGTDLAAIFSLNNNAMTRLTMIEVRFDDHHEDLDGDDDGDDEGDVGGGTDLAAIFSLNNSVMTRLTMIEVRFNEDN